MYKISECISVILSLLLLFVACGVTAWACGLEIDIIFRTLSGFVYSIGFVITAVVIMHLLGMALSRMPLACVFFITPLFYSMLAIAGYMFGGLVDQPHPIYATDSWEILRFKKSFFWGMSFLIATAAVISTDHFLFGSIRARELIAYYPTLTGLRRANRSSRSRLVLTSSFLLLLAYYTATAVDLYHIESYSGGMVWPPERVFSVCMVLWGVLWISDAVERQGFATLFAAVGFVFICLLLMGAHAFVVVRE